MSYDQFYCTTGKRTQNATDEFSIRLDLGGDQQASYTPDRSAGFYAEVSRSDI